MSNGQREDKEHRISRIYHSDQGLENAPGVSAVPSGDTVIAGDDDRKDLADLSPQDATEALYRTLVASTVLLTDIDRLTERPDGSFRLSTRPFRRGGLGPCGDERFGGQITGGWCTGFQVGPDLIVTAGHCGETNAEIQETAYVFGFQVATAGGAATTDFSADQVYFGAELVAHDLSDDGDFAVVRVDRVITAPGAAPLLIRRDGSIGIGQNVGVIGHPSGLPVKVAFGDDTVVMTNQAPWIVANLDTYGGNSGSPVFNAAGEVEGVLVRGAKDYEIDPANGCFRSNRVTNAEGSEVVTRASVFTDHVPEVVID